MSRFAPVHLPEDRKLDKRVSQTLLRHMARCPRSAYLYALYKGEAQTDAMVRGSAAHAIFEWSIKLAVENSEQIIPPEIVRDVLSEVLGEFAVPLEEHDALRELTYRWASQWTLEPSNVVACETLYVLEIAGWQVRCKVDFAEDRAEGLYIADFKTGKGAVSLDSISRKRTDGSRIVNAFQLLLYALAVTYGRKLDEGEPGETICDACGSLAYLEVGSACNCGDGTLQKIYALGPLPKGPRDVIAEFVYPAIEIQNGDRAGQMLRRPDYRDEPGPALTPLELQEGLESLTSLLKRLEGSVEGGDWPAIISDAGCAECPAPSECPIPAELREYRGAIQDVDHARETLEVADREGTLNRQKRAVVKAFCKESDIEIRFGADKVARFVVSDKQEVDKDGLLAAVEHGERHERSDYVTTKTSTNFVDVRLSAEELEQEAANG